jgi:hypothetical protein
MSSTKPWPSQSNDVIQHGVTYIDDLLLAQSATAYLYNSNRALATLLNS